MLVFNIRTRVSMVRSQFRLYGVLNKYLEKIRRNYREEMSKNVQESIKSRII